MREVEDQLDDARSVEEEVGMESKEGGLLNGNAQKYWEWMRLVLGTLIIPWCMWISFTLVGIDKRVAIIENNRFDSEDGRALWQELNAKADKNQVPPQWFIDQFNRLRDDLESHKVRTRDEELGR